MTAKARPYREHGSVKKTGVNFSARIDGKLKRRVDAVADAIGVSQGRALELILENLEIDANGRPSWWTGPLAVAEDEELPLQSAS